MKKFISIVNPCYNEEANVENLYKQIKSVIAECGDYEYEHIFIDNNSSDNTVKIIKDIAKVDKNVKLIVNSRNFGQVRSPFYGLLQASGEAVIIMASDLQDPPWMIKDLLVKWEQGYKVVKAVKTHSKESAGMFFVRKAFYTIIKKLSDVELTKHFDGTGLYDKEVIKILRNVNDPYPFLRGLVAEIGFEQAIVEYTQRFRKEGKSKHNFYSLFDMAILGIVSCSKIPLRFASILGFLLSGISLFLAVLYFVLKLIFWRSFPIGSAPMIIAIFFFSSVQLFFIGVLGEYISIIYTKVQNRPLVIEKERVNFDNKS